MGTLPETQIIFFRSVVSSQTVFLEACVIHIVGSSPGGDSGPTRPKCVEGSIGKYADAWASEQRAKHPKACRLKETLPIELQLSLLALCGHDGGAPGGSTPPMILLHPPG
jgi:hypothetical protein